MTRPGLTRTSSGLSPAHIELIRLLAAKAVEDYLAEGESRRDNAMSEET